MSDIQRYSVKGNNGRNYEIREINATTFDVWQMPNDHNLKALPVKLATRSTLNSADAFIRMHERGFHFNAGR